MQTYYATVRNNLGVALAGAPVAVYLSDGITLATGLLDANGASQSNPFQTDLSGQFAFSSVDGSYVASVTTPTGIEKRKVVLLDETVLVPTVEVYTTGATTLSSQNMEVLYNASGGTINQVVPSMSNFSGTVKFKFWKTDSSPNPVNISLTSPDVFLGAFTSPFALTTQGSSFEIQADYTLGSWRVK